MTDDEILALAQQYADARRSAAELAAWLVAAQPDLDRAEKLFKESSDRLQKVDASNDAALTIDVIMSTARYEARFRKAAAAYQEKKSQSDAAAAAVTAAYAALVAAL